MRAKRIRSIAGGKRVNYWTPENIARLGREPDRPIADSLEISVSAVGIRPRLLGIKPPARPKPKWTRTMVRRLGKIPDAMIAADFGINFMDVVVKRKMLGITGYNRS